MQQDKSQKTDAAATRSFYKSRFLACPAVYVQEEGGWRSYGLGGEMREAEGRIPQNILDRINPIPESEALELIEERLEEAARIKAERAVDLNRMPATSDEYYGKKPLWSRLPRWAFVPIGVGLGLDAFGAAYRIIWPHFICVAIWLLTWLAARSYPRGGRAADR